MKALALAFSAFALILFFWAVLLLGIVTSSIPSLSLTFIPTLFDAIKTLCAIGAGLIAWQALKTWKRTLKAQKRTEFLDQFMTATLEYTTSMNQVISAVEYCQRHYRGTVEFSEEPPELIDKNFILRFGEHYQKQFRPLLDNSAPLLAKLTMLRNKGLIFNFHDYNRCTLNVKKLKHLWERIDSFSGLFHMTFVNSEHINPTLLKILKTDEDYYEKIVKEVYEDLVKYVRERYSEMHD